ncbi:MAG: DUF2099 family protein [Candidatus Methanospirare jalkutatii]|nr:MAG: DUF2099 family protein [Candidatus Methanospirare jalkutatii]UYZ40835.1 MAG: DUF2099 family protein [Candidatus Methanospirare jalkutatii]
MGVSVVEMPADRHVLELLGKTRVVIERGKVVEVGEPLVRYCPLWEKLGIKRIDSDVVRSRVEFQMRDFGLCSPNRRLDLGVFVDFGASETLMTALRRNILDAVVSVCDGAGTVITSNPELVQGIGARISGILETSPIDALLKRLKVLGGVTLNPPRIDQAEGLRKAIEMGFSRIGVTVASVEDALACRTLGEKSGKSVVIFGVHLTGISASDAERICEVADVVTACASAVLRELAGKNALLQAGTAIPMFALTQIGKELMLERAKEVQRTLILSASKIPKLAERQPEPLI